MGRIPKKWYQAVSRRANKARTLALSPERRSEIARFANLCRNYGREKAEQILATEKAKPARR